MYTITKKEFFVSLSKNLSLTATVEYSEKPSSEKSWCTPETKFLVPEWGDILDYDKGLSYRPASLCSLVGRQYNPMLQSTRRNRQCV